MEHIESHSTSPPFYRTQRSIRFYVPNNIVVPQSECVEQTIVGNDMAFLLQADSGGGGVGGGSGGRKNRRGLTTMSLNESQRGSAGGSGPGGGGGGGSAGDFF